MGAGALAQRRDRRPAQRAVRAGQADLDQLVVVERLFQLPHDGVGEAALAEANDGLAPVGAGAEVGDLGPSKHDSGDSATEGESLARRAGPALADIKRELAAIVVVGAAGAPLVIHYLEGTRELGVLAAYGVGAALWVHTRARGVLLALRRGQGRGSGDGA